MESEELNMANAEATTEAQEEELEINLDDTEDVEALKAELEKTKNFAKQAVARAHKAEAEVKGLKTPKKEAEATQTITNALSEEAVEAKILKSQGVSDELIKELTALAKVRGTSLLDTQNDPIYLAIKETREAELKAAKAKLPASKGSGYVKQGKDFNSPNLTEEEHKALWLASQQR